MYEIRIKIPQGITSVEFSNELLDRIPNCHPIQSETSHSKVDSITVKPAGYLGKDADRESLDKLRQELERLNYTIID